MRAILTIRVTLPTEIQTIEQAEEFLNEEMSYEFTYFDGELDLDTEIQNQEIIK